MTQFHQVFFDETDEHLASMESLLLELDIHAPDQEALNAIFRAAHSIKGGSATFGFSDLAELTHVLENLLDRIRKGTLDLTAPMVDAFLHAKDVLAALLASHRGGEPVEEAEVEQVKQTLDALGQGQQEVVSAPQAAPAPPAWHDLFIEIDPLESVDVAALIDDLSRHGELQTVQQGSAEPALPWVLKLHSAMDLPEVCETLAFALDPSVFRVTRDLGAEETEGFGLFLGAPAAPSPDVMLEEDGFGLFTPVDAPHEAIEDEGFGLFHPVPPPPAAEPAQASPHAAPPHPPTPGERSERAAPAASSAASAENSIRVNIEKVDLLLNLVGELVITQSMLMQSGNALDSVEHERLINGINLLQRNSRELQEAVMSIRMTPVAFVFNRFPRVVRDMAQKLDKQVELKMVGENTELDKSFIEKLADPLTHLVRNSLDHGIESPEERIRKGKSPQGQLTLRAFHQGGSIVIEVTDDGAGLDRERILAKARERGMAVSDSMSDVEVWNLIFEPGFSTAAQITDVSGRGVGMDVVKRNIQTLGGRVEIESLRDYGTTIGIHLPLTLAIMDGMSVRIGQETYILPLSFILESLQPQPQDVRTVSGRGRVVNVRGEYLPIVALGKMFHVPDARHEPTEAILIIVESDDTRVALLVDDLIGQQQFVVKNLETNYHKVEGLSGATIMGDGHVALILDVTTIVRRNQKAAQALSMNLASTE
ncbi:MULTISPECIES: chemotaxis protein CheW [unclassified Paludibacterium]|uniref:chemotaxis protein CheW n=1 Tax=unclassified Paludibacterium TaxID=2618429 RepID=UPI00207B64A5|nr:chemotaxis protein CheW [Paludibacterium sp. B53371]